MSTVGRKSASAVETSYKYPGIQFTDFAPRFCCCLEKWILWTSFVWIDLDLAVHVSTRKCLDQPTSWPPACVDNVYKLQ